MARPLASQTLWQAGEPVRAGARVLNVLTTAAVMVGLLSVAFEYGYWTPPLPRPFLQSVQLGAVAVFLLDLLGRFVLSQNRRGFAARRWADLSLLALLAVALAAQWVRGSGLPAGEMDLWHSPRLALLVYIAAQTLLRALRLNMILAHSRMDPARLMLASFLAFILLGTAALMLPRSTPPGSPIHFVDAAFTSTSAMCVTGLVVRPTGSDQADGTPARMLNDDLPPGEFSLLGQVVILLLIQLGGLGIMIFGTIFAVLMGQQLSLRQGLVMQDMTASHALGPIRRVVRFIFLATFLFEAAGAVLFFTTLSSFDWPAGQKVFFAVFHSVSAFCNAGFSLTPDSFVRYHGYWQVHCVIAPLIVIGGLGFPVLMNLHDYGWAHLRRWLGRPINGLPPRLTLHSRLVLWATAILILGGAAGLLLMESPLTGRGRPQVGTQEPTTSAIEMAQEKKAERDSHQLRRESAGQSLADAVFMSLTARTAGFNTVEMDYNGSSLTDGSLFVLILLMLIGGSPASTAGGMKTVTLAVLVLTAVSAVRRREEVEGFRRSLPAEIIRRAATVFVCYIGMVFLVTLALTITESGSNFPFIRLLFESASGCGTVGLTTNLTGELSIAGRVVMTLAMFAGRLGPLTLLVAITMRRPQARYQLPQERVVLG